MSTGTDNFSDQSTGMDSPGENAASITTHDTNELANYTRGIYVGTTGNIKITTVNGDTVTFNNVAAGVILPMRAKIVFQTGTTAADLVAIW